MPQLRETPLKVPRNFNNLIIARIFGGDEGRFINGLLPGLAYQPTAPSGLGFRYGLGLNDHEFYDNARTRQNKFAINAALTF